MIATDISDRWSDHPARVDRLERLLGSLDTWRKWALGHNVPAHQLSDSAVVIRQAAVNAGRQAPLAEFAATVDGWATSARLDLPPASPQPQWSAPGPSVGLGIEL